MIDISKHTEDQDLSRFDYTETVQDSNRNLKRPSKINLTSVNTIDLRLGGSSPSKVGLNSNPTFEGINDIKNSLGKLVYSSNELEESKTHDITINYNIDVIKQSFLII